MKRYFLAIIIICLLLFGCNKTPADTNTNPSTEEKFSCNVYETSDGVYINNTGDAEIKKASVDYKITWVDTADQGIHEKEFEVSKDYSVLVTAGNVAKIDSLSICLPPEKKTKSNLFKCEAKVTSPCSAEHLFVMSYYYNTTSEKETFENPSLDEYVEMYNALKTEFS